MNTELWFIVNAEKHIGGIEELIPQGSRLYLLT